MAIERRTILQIVEACIAAIPATETELLKRLAEIRDNAGAVSFSPDHWHKLAEAFAKYIGDARTAPWKMKVANIFAGREVFPEGK